MSHPLLPPEAVHPPGQPRLFDRPPFERARHHAARQGCDVAIPCYLGIGSLVCFTSLVEAMARSLGRPLRMLHGPGTPAYGRHPDEAPYPLWEQNPYLDQIVDADTIDGQIMRQVSREMDNFCQLGHVIEGICTAYGLRPGRLAGSLFLSLEEQRWALDQLAHLRRPVVFLCPYGRSSSPEGSPWYLEKWLRLIERLEGQVGFVHSEREGHRKPLPIPGLSVTLRQSLALIWASDLYVGFDTGPAHIATAFGRPSVVLWDALEKTPLEDAKQPGFGIAHMSRWAYPQNRNLVILHERHDEVLEAVVGFVREQVFTLGFDHIGAKSAPRVIE